MSLLVDCSVSTAWGFEDQSDAYTQAALRHAAGSGASAPALWRFETANVLVQAQRRGVMAAADALAFLRLLDALEIEVEQAPDGEAMGRILELSARHGLSAYDAAYLESAVRRGAPLATKDRRLAAAAQAEGVLFAGA